MTTLTDEEIVATIDIQHHPRFNDLNESEKKLVVYDCDISLTDKEVYRRLETLNLRVHKSYCSFSGRYRYLVFEDDLYFLFEKSDIKYEHQKSNITNVFVILVIILIIAYLYYS